MCVCVCEQKESEALHKREVQLRERERALRDAEKLSHTTDIIIDKVVTQEVENRCQAVTEVKFFPDYMSMSMAGLSTIFDFMIS